MQVVNSRRIAQLSMGLSQLLSHNPRGLSRNQALEGLIDSASVGSHEMAAHPYRPFVPLFEEMVRVGNVALVRAGWLAEQSGHWELTPQGVEALDRLSEPDEFLRAAARSSVRARLAIAFPAMYIALRRWKYQISVDYSLVKRVGIRKVLTQPAKAGAPWQDVLPMQALDSDETPAQTTEFLDFYVTKQHYRIRYVSRREASDTPLAILAQRYPDDASFVVAKNLLDSSQGGDIKGREITGREITGREIITANLLYSNGLGPKLYDVIRAGGGESGYTIYVIGGGDYKRASSEESAQAWQRLSALEETGWIGVRAAEGNFDGSGLDAGDAWLVDGNGSVQYVGYGDIFLKDYESYLKKVAIGAIDSSHFGDRSLLRGGHYLYQSVPGVRLPARRDTKARMDTIGRLMESVDAKFTGKLVLDIGCNIGMMMAEYLRLGVRWCHGWDRVDVAPHTEGLLMALGCTRFSVTGGDIARAGRLEDDIPEFIRPELDGCIISYLAVRKNFGFLDCLGRIPWSLMIYEGHEEETRQDFERYLFELKQMVNVQVKAISAYRDGDCGERVVAMIVRT
ncbi:MAG TPA: hypothetical protein VI756_18850 [Blastocatellia bacterium]